MFHRYYTVSCKILQFVFSIILSMKISVLGATGPSGQQTVLEALERGYSVVALVRNPDKLTVKDDKLQVKVTRRQGRSKYCRYRCMDIGVWCSDRATDTLEPRVFQLKGEKPLRCFRSRDHHQNVLKLKKKYFHWDRFHVNQALKTKTPLIGEDRECEDDGARLFMANTNTYVRSKLKGEGLSLQK